MKKLTTEEFINKANVKHNFKYDYSQSIYTNAKSKIKIICHNHNNLFIFEQKANNHLNGKGCYKCNGGIGSNTNEWVEKANKIHNNKYNYNESKYINKYTLIDIFCPTHGKFRQTPSVHLRGHGCPECSGNTSDINKFIQKSNLKHNYKYDYSESNYINCKTKLKIKCKNHGYFYLTPSKHLSGQGCKDCSFEKCRYVSKKESQWLNHLEKTYNIKIIRQYYVKELKFKVDGFCVETNTIFEFNGDFWHGNPKIFNSDDINPKKNVKYKILYEETLSKENKIKSLGYNLESIWESDFDVIKL